MKKLSLLTLLLVLCLPLAASAQEEAPKVEMFGGYSFLRVNPGQGADGVSAHGFNTSLAGNITKNIGIVGEFSRFTKSANISDVINDPIFGSFEAHARVSTFMFGPRFTLRGGNAEPFVHALFGGAHGNFKASAGGLSEEVSGVAFAYALGGGLDIKAHDNFAIRIAQLDYIQARVAGQGLNNLRYSAGVVLRFGKR
ncbi:MAG TPA: outer membrane beta-barrel protein [Blastocatellia bacterium]|nr:outer membrane beta-barrel protein [Blastocatellia bacterium]